MQDAKIGAHAAVGVDEQTRPVGKCSRVKRHPHRRAIMVKKIVDSNRRQAAKLTSTFRYPGKDCRRSKLWRGSNRLSGVEKLCEREPVVADKLGIHRERGRGKLVGAPDVTTRGNSGRKLKQRKL